jgi:transcriptional regulator with XRE-family HTH domain
MIPSFGERLRNLRLSRGLSQGDLAKRIGKSISMIGMYENSARMPSYETLIRFAKTFNVTTDYLLGVEASKIDAFDFGGLTDSQVKSVFTMIDEYRKANGRG